MVRRNKNKNKTVHRILDRPYNPCSMLRWHTIPNPDVRLEQLQVDVGWNMDEEQEVEQEQEEQEQPIPTTLSGIQELVEKLADDCDDPTEMEQLLSMMEMISQIQGMQQ